MTNTKPLTRAEFDRLFDDDGCNQATRVFLARKKLLATIEAGGFAPEPITEGPTEKQLLTWVRQPEQNTFCSDDLGRALARAASYGVAASIYRPARLPGWIVEWGTAHHCITLATAARTLAALGYAEAKRPDTPDMTHLLGNQDSEVCDDRR